MPLEEDLAGFNDPFNPFQKILRALKALGDVTAEHVNSLQIEITAIPLISKVGFPSVNIATGAVISKGARLARRPIQGQFAGYMTIPEYIEGLEELQRIIRSGELFEITKRNYDITVRAFIREKTSARNSLKRGGSGGGNTKKGNIMFLSRPDFELGEQWRTIIKELDVPLVQLPGGRMGSYSLQQILEHNVEQYRSQFTNVYMMVEFGTGEFARPGPRRYAGASTPFKLTPAMSGGLGGDTSWWFSNLLQKKIAQNMLKSHESPSVASITFGHGPKGITPLGVLFDNRGMVSGLREAYRRFYELSIREINELIASRVPFWPRNALKPNDKTVVQIVEAQETLFRRLTRGR